MAIVLILSFYINLVSGFSLNDQVHQSPKDLYNTNGASAEVKCSHDIQNFDRILWYKQLRNGQMQFLGYMLDTLTSTESEAKVQMSGSASKGQTSILTIEEPSSAVYYCAASLTVRKSPDSRDKNHSELAV
ncbi:unnamed protein product [Knipowitschia caucasica]